MSDDLRADLIHDFLGDAKGAVGRRDWEAVLDLVEDVLVLEPESQDALTLRLLAERHVGRSRVRESRRHETVVFADLVASTALANRFDPEFVHQLIRDYEQACTPALTGLGGHVHRFVGDGILASFGYPTSHEDDACRAVQAGLDLVAAVDRISERYRDRHAELRVRVGIASGVLVHGDRGDPDWSQPGDLFGPAVNLAARLHEVAEPGAVVVSPDTVALLRGAFELELVGSRRLKGFDDPVVVQQVRRRRDPGTVVDPSAASPFVGRNAELTDLHTRWAQVARASGNGQKRGTESRAVVLWGEAGVGKSRLLHEFLQATRSADRSVVEVRCSAYRSSSPLHPVRSAMERLSGIGPDDADDVRLEKLAATIEKTTDPSDVLPYFALLLELETDGRIPRPEMSPLQLREITLAHLHQWISNIATRSPTVLILEDLHWADPSTEDLLGRVVRSRPPGLFTIVTSRNAPDAALSGELDVHRLDPLSSGEAQALAQAVGRDLPPDVLAEVARRSDGVPLFVEHLADSLAQAARTGTAGRDAVPLTLAELLQARLDTVGSSKVVAQLAATVGREFEADVIEAVAQRLADGRLIEPFGRPVGEDIERLIEARLVERDPETDDGLRFRHALVREAAYESQLLGERPERHEAVAQLLVDRGLEGRAADPAVIAFHFDRAERPLDAIQHYLTAAERGQAIGAYAEVVTHLERAAALLPTVPADLRPGLELTICFYRGLAISSAGGYAAQGVADDFWRAVELCEQVDDAEGSVVRAQLGLWTYYSATGNLRTARAVSGAMYGQLDRVHMPAARPGFHACRGVEHFFAGELPEARQHLDTAIELLDHDDIDPLTWPLPNCPLAASLAFVSQLCLIHGDAPGAIAAIERAVARCEQLPFPLGPFSLAFVRTHESWMNRVWLNFDAALSAAEDVLHIGERYGFFDWVMTGRMNVAATVVAAGPTVDALDEMGAAIALWRSVGGRCLLPSLLLEQAEGYFALGDVERATARLDDAQEMADEGQRLSLAGIHRLRAELIASVHGAGHPDIEAELLAGMRFAHGQGAPAFVVQCARTYARITGEDSLSDNLRRVYEGALAPTEPSAGPAVARQDHGPQAIVGS